MVSDLPSAIELLSQCKRTELRSSSFSDSEVSWYLGKEFEGEPIASGYFSGSTDSRVTIYDGDKAVITFLGNKAYELRNVGILAYASRES